VNLKLRYGDFTTISRQESLGHPTDDAGEIYASASRLLETERAENHRPVRLLGVAVTGLLQRTQMNLDLFGGPGAETAAGSDGKPRPGGGADPEGGPHPRREDLNRALDRLEDRFGPDTVTRGRTHTARSEDSLEDES
jgi:hypothetical protein